MNINFSTEPGFSAYVLLLMFSGLAMVAIGSSVRGQRPLSRFLTLAFGLGYVGYGFYLAFVFDGGHYLIFFKAFILPPVLIIRSLMGSRRAAPKVQTYPKSAYVPPRSDGGTSGHWNPTPAQGSPMPAQPTPWDPAPAAPTQWNPTSAAPAQWNTTDSAGPSQPNA